MKSFVKVNGKNFMTAKKSCIKKRLQSCVLLLLLVGFTTQIAVAQLGGAAAPNVAHGSPAGSYKLSEFESVNLFSGNLNFNLPSLTLGGRGGAQYVVPIKIKTSKWKMEREGYTVNFRGSTSNEPDTQQGGIHQITVTDPPTRYEVEVCDSITEGCVRYHSDRSNLDRTVIQLDGRFIQPEPQTLGTVYYHPNPNGWYNVDTGYGPGILQGRMLVRHRTISPRLTRLVFTGPDGTELELRDQLTGGEPDRSPNGPITRGRIFKSYDGTGITFISDTPITDDRTQMGATLGSAERSLCLFKPSGYLLFPDGTRYRIRRGLVDWIRDRNGNSITFEYDDQDRVRKAKDSLNREVNFRYVKVIDGSGKILDEHDEIQYTGSNGQPRVIKVTYSDLDAALQKPLYPNVKTLGQLFGEYGLDPNEINTPFNPTRVVKSIQLPDEREYEIFYNPYQNISRIILPTGGAYEYKYEQLATAFNVQFRVQERSIYKNHRDSIPESKQVYEMSFTPPTERPMKTTVKVDQKRGLDEAVLTSEKHYFHGNTLSYQAGIYSPWNEGKEFKTEIIDPNRPEGNNILRTVEYEWKQRPAESYDKIWWTFEGGPAIDPRLVETKTTLENGLSSKQTSINPQSPDSQNPIIGFDRFNNQTDLWEYDFDGALVRHTQTDYLMSQAINGGMVDYVCDPVAACSDLINPIHALHLRGLPTQKSVYDGKTGKRISLMSFEYDNYSDDAKHKPLQVRSNITGLCMEYAPRSSDPAFVDCKPPEQYDAASYKARGNVTATMHHILNPAGNSIGAVSAFNQYDVAGNVIKAIDGEGNQTEIFFGDNFGTADESARNGGLYSSLNGKQTYAFPSSFRNALGHTVYTQYDYNTGQAVNFEDANGTVSSYHYEDLLDRPTKVESAVNIASSRSQTIFSYDNGNRKITTTSDLNTYRDGALKSELLYDGLGRTVETRNYETSTQYIATLREYDALGRIYGVSKPFRPTMGQSPVLTRKEYDALGRIITVTTPDDPDRTKSAPLDSKVITAYRGNQVQVTDQDGKSTRSETDALGRLTSVVEFTRRLSDFRVVEDPANSDYETSYKYDVLGNLRKVDQGGQKRFFAYDSLGRLVRAKNPEQENLAADDFFQALSDDTSGERNDQWSIAYSYDNNGNLVRRKDARNVSTIYNYDALSRNFKISYEGESGTKTPSIDLLYDTAVNGKGRLRATVTEGVSATSIDEYDELGRVKLQRQNFWVNNAWGQSYLINPTYDLAGNVRTLAYPSGHTVSYSYDSSGRLSDSNGKPAFEGDLGDGQMRTYSSAVLYDPLGGMNQERFGTDIPVYNKSYYNNRGQLAEIRVGTTALPDSGWNRGAILNVYSAAPVDGWTSSGADNNGNLRKQMIYIPHGDNPATDGSTNFVQYYGYDQLNRLKSVEDKENNSTVNFRQAFDYDRWGNRTINADLTTDNINKKQFFVDPNAKNNRLNVPQNQSGVMSYDGAGNLTFDSYTGAGTRTFDAENRMTTAQISTAQIASYTYDGGGKRIKRNTATGESEIWQVYGIGGELLAEYAANSAPSQPKTEYGYRNGQMLVVAERNTPAPASVINFGFESPTVGGGNFKYLPTAGNWIFAGGSGISGNNSAFTYANPPAPEGSQVAFIQGGSESNFSQPISGLQSDGYYKVVFKAAQRGSGNQPGQDFDVYFDSKHLGTLRPAGTSYAELSTLSFMADSDTGTLKFVGRNSSGGDNTAFIDDVRIVRAAAPSEAYLSDLNWTNVQSDYYQTTKDHTVNGNAIRLNGVTYQKGLGVHANSDIRFSLGGNYSTFTSDIGIDDNATTAGSVVFQVWADGAKLYDSGVMTPTSPTKTVNVNVAGKRELKLVVTQAGDGPAWDHADWANARLKSETYLSDLDWSYSQGDYYPTTKDRTVNGNAIRLNRATYQKGLGVHANSDVRFNLGGNYSTFISDIGVDDNATTVGSVVFEVWADGAKLYDSGVMTPTSPTKTVNVNVAGKRELKLVVTQAGDGPTWDHADWADARLTKSSAVQPGNPAPGAVQIKWLVTDQLGTPRMTIDQTGRLAGVTRHDYLPFGEEISHLREQLFPGIELKRGYIADNVRQQFTGYERDTETGLDYAQARYYSNVQGRFTGVDPLLASGNPSNPQSWNRYGYVLNNPMRLTDPTGMIPQDTQKTKPEQQTAPMPQAPQEDPLSPEDINGPADAVIYEHDVTGYNEAVRKADSAAELCVNKAVNNLMLGIDQATPTKKQFFTELGVGIGVGAIAGAQITSKSKSIHFSLLGAGVGAIGGEIAAVTNLLNNQAKGYRDAKLAFITEIENCKLEWKHAMPKELPHSVITWDFENINRGGLEAKKIQSSRNPWFFVNKTVEKYRKETQ